MKKLLIALFFVFLLSCEKDSQCWQCITKIVTTCNGYASYDSEIIIDKCNLSRNAIRDYEEAYNKTTMIILNGIICTSKSTCKCSR